jgi:hypothetical protein
MQVPPYIRTAALEECSDFYQEPRRGQLPLERAPLLVDRLLARLYLMIFREGIRHAIAVLRDAEIDRTGPTYAARVANAIDRLEREQKWMEATGRAPNIIPRRGDRKDRLRLWWRRNQKGRS